MSAAVLLLYWWPRSAAPASVQHTVHNASDLQFIRLLDSQLSNAVSFDVARSFVHSLVNFEETETLATKLDAIEELSTSCGLNPRSLLAQISFDIETQYILTRMWNEKAAVAYTSSNALTGLSLIVLLISPGAVHWTLTQGFGILSALIGIALTLVARLVIRRIKQNALTESFSTVKQLPTTLVIGTPFIIPIISFSTFTLAFATLGSCLLSYVIPRLPSARVAGTSREIRFHQRWLVAIWKTAADAGADWLRTVELSLLSADISLQSSLQSLMTRLRWGIAAHHAFTGDEWNEIAAVLEQGHNSGAKTSTTLHALLEEMNQSHRSARITSLERHASRAVIPVSLLQLPAFIVIAIVPILATQIAPLLDIVASTTN